MLHSRRVALGGRDSCSGLVVGALALLSADARAHGEDHVEAAATAPRAVMEGATVDGAVELGAGAVWLWAADHDTTAPVAGAEVHLSLTGPGSVELDLQPGPHPGSWTAPLPALEAGSWGGSVVLGGGVTDLLAVSLTVGAHAEEEHEHSLALAPLLAAALGVGLLLGLLVGRRAAPAALVLLAARGQAHGDDHAEPAAAPGGALQLPLSSQLLVGLRTSPVASEPLQPVVRGLGRLTPVSGELHLAAPVTGQLLAGARTLVPGLTLQEGDLLLRLRETPPAADRVGIAVQRTSVAAGLAEAQRALVLAERDAAQAEGLGGSLSGRERLDREQRLISARAAVAQAGLALDALAEGAITPLVAPWAGVVTRVHQRPGAVVQAGEPLVDAVGDGALRAEVRVAEAVPLAEGARARVEVAGQAVDAVVLDPGHAVDGGGVVVTLDLLGAVEARAGASVTAWIEVGAAREGLRVPEGALLVGTGAPFVFVKTGPESFGVRDLRFGERVLGGREVLAGLQPGERVVVAEAQVLQRSSGR